MNDALKYASGDTYPMFGIPLVERCYLFWQLPTVYGMNGMQNWLLMVSGYAYMLYAKYHSASI